MIQRTQGSVIDNSGQSAADYIFDQIYFEARRNKDTGLMERLRKTYLDYNNGQFEFIERLSSEMFGREISQRAQMTNRKWKITNGK